MPSLTLRIDLRDNFYFDTDQIRLLELVAECGSIAHAAKAMNTSYKRAWYMLRDFSAMFSLPLLETNHGGPNRGARLTPFAEELVRSYRKMEVRSEKAFAKPLKWIEGHLTDSRARRRLPRAAGKAAAVE
jgi:molybdate transport system regulatory protein